MNKNIATSENIIANIFSCDLFTSEATILTGTLIQIF